MTTTDTRTPAERRYDAERDGSAYVKPQMAPRLADSAASPEARAIYDTLSPDAQRVADRLIEIIDAMPDEKAKQATDLVLLTLDGLAEPPAIEVTHLYRDPSKGDDLTDEPCGPLAYTDYTLGSDDTRVLISFDANGNELHEIIVQGQYVEGPIEAHLATMEAAIANMRRLLADPRVQAARRAA